MNIKANLIPNVKTVKRVKWFDRWDALILLAVIFFKGMVFSFSFVPSESMVPTLAVGDRVLLNRFEYSLRKPTGLAEHFSEVSLPERGDVVTFNLSRTESRAMIKRVIGLPGDVIETKGQMLFVNGKPLSRQLVSTVDGHAFYHETLNGVKYTVRYKMGVKHSDVARRSGRWVVPKDHFFAMGDNRDYSRDARMSEAGGYHKDLLLSKATVVLGNWNSADLRVDRIACSLYDTANHGAYDRTCI